MRRSALLALPLCLAIAGVAVAAIRTNHYSIATARDVCLGVGDGKLVLCSRSGSDENETERDRWLVENGQIKSSVGKGYLTYDPADKEGKVFLAREPMKGASLSMALFDRSSS